MKKYLFTILTIFLIVVGCTKFPIDEDGLLITDREDCYISNLELLGADQRSVLTEKLVVIDEEKLTISAEVQFGTDLRNIYPQFSLATDAKLDPKIVGKVDFSDLEHPKQYTVISGNRKVRKTYTVLITVQQP
ncbi:MULTISPECIES: hypothetical protein [Bacteroidales]|jgi:hypothetical protein|uniref:Lipoprotein n=1 Tax=Coprobacter secundus subsp. similis TaxID=2751153 RepID=A0A7G1HWF3_9BACT|nr:MULTISPECIES: hypothetical protein [Bacteroidales]KHM48610.1 hypothetical protein PU94_02860 [Coprobacter secundus]BCI63363.1 hypothetical protein Cop2CBH44_17160 [Coprobacter secundus subsp. similis]CCY36971.1 uncharacterized protein BN472_00023 [Tannerella sp. CAG:118]